MREPRAVPTAPQSDDTTKIRAPRAFTSEQAKEGEDVFADSPESLAASGVTPEPRKRGGFWRALALWTGATLVSLGVGLAAERLIRDLFARYDWLGWFGLAILVIFILAMAVLVLREIVGLMRLRALDSLRERAAQTLQNDDLEAARAIAGNILALYESRTELARARTSVEGDIADRFDGAEIIRTTERGLMAPLDKKARALTAASARRVALVTAVAPRALIDIAFVVFESVRLARNLADLYGARPGFFGFLRLIRSILAHLAVTGGLVLTDGVVEQLVGQSMATKLSARLGEGMVNGLMTVRVGIAAMRVVRPLPFDTQKSPVVTDFLGALTKVGTDKSAQQ